MPAIVLMERAGLAVFQAVQEFLPDGGKIAVVCGKGNNGGDGLVVARLAHERGFTVSVLMTAEESDLREECRLQLLQLQAYGLMPIFPSDDRWEMKMDCLGMNDVLVDAIIGIGAEGIIQGKPAQAISAMNRAGVPIVAVDVPSGIHTDSGDELGESIWAMRTITFGNPKPFLFQGIGLEHSGHWTVEHIGFPPRLLSEPTDAMILDGSGISNVIPERLRGSHKGVNGHILIVAGSHAMRGAAALAAKAAFRSGAGMVTVAAIDSVCDAVMTHCPEAVLVPLPEQDGILTRDSAEVILASKSKFTGALFGPGLTHQPQVVDFLNRVWSNWDVPSCIDADALNAVSLGVQLPDCPCVLTPHPGEMSRLLQSTIAEVQADRFAAVCEAVEKFGKAIILKGPYSLASAPGLPCLVNSTGNPGMASAGMGDVLAGVIATLLGQEIPPCEAAAAGMFWHGLAGDLAAEDSGAIGFTARDVILQLAAARAKLTES